MTTGPTEIIGSADCGNSPKNAFVQDIAIALETGVASVELFDPEITWTRTSTKTLEGQAGVLQAVRREIRDGLGLEQAGERLDEVNVAVPLPQLDDAAELLVAPEPVGELCNRLRRDLPAAVEPQ